MEKKVCPECGYKTNDLEAQYCSRCGSSLLWVKKDSSKLFMRRNGEVVFRMEVRGEETYRDNLIDWENSKINVNDIMLECKKYGLSDLWLTLDIKKECLELSIDGESNLNLCIYNIPYTLFSDFYKYKDIINMNSLIYLSAVGGKIYSLLSDDDKLKAEMGVGKYENR